MSWLWTTPLALPVVPEVKNIAATSSGPTFATSASKKPGCVAIARATGGEQRVEWREAGLVVVAQAARVVEPDVRQLRALGANLDQLVDLLLVLDHREGDVGVGDRPDELGRGRVLVERHRDRAERLRREHRGVEPRPVLADHDQVLAALQACFGEPAGERLHQLGEGAPGERLPDAELLLAQRRRVRARGGVIEQEAREGRLHRCEERGKAPRRPKRWSDFRKILTPCCRSDDKLRDNTLGCIPLRARLSP